MSDYPPNYIGSLAAPKSWHPEDEPGADMKPWEYYEKQQAAAMMEFDFLVLKYQVKLT